MTTSILSPTLKAAGTVERIFGSAEVTGCRLPESWSVAIRDDVLHVSFMLPDGLDYWADYLKVDITQSPVCDLVAGFTIEGHLIVVTQEQS